MSCCADQAAKGGCPAPNRSTPSSSAAGSTTLERVAQVGSSPRSTVLADAGDDLDGVAQQLLVQPARVGQPRLAAARRGRRARVGRGRGSSCRRARTPTRRRASGGARRGSRCARAKRTTPAHSSARARPGALSAWHHGSTRATLNLTHGLLPPGRRAAALLRRRRRGRDRDDAVARCSSWALRNPEIDVTFTSLSMSYQPRPRASRRCVLIRQVKQRDIDYEDLTLVDHLVRDVLARPTSTSPRPGPRWPGSCPSGHRLPRWAVTLGWGVMCARRRA